MIIKKDIYVLEIGSEKLSLISFQSNTSNPQITGLCTKNYSGFQEGEFLCPEEIYPTIKKLIENFCVKYNKNIKKLIIGFPGEFSCIISKNVEIDIDKRVTQNDIDQMQLIGNTYQAHNQFVTVDVKSIFYKTNCNPQRLHNPLGQSCERMVGKISYMLLERYFKSIFDDIAKRMNIKISYLSSMQAAVNYCNKIKSVKELSSNLIIDLGYLSSAIAYSIGDGIMYMRSFSLGGGTVAGDITLVMDIPFSHGYALYKKLNLNLKPNNEETYTIFVDGESFCYDIKTINAIAEERILNIAGYIKLAIDSCDVGIESNIPLCMYGSTLCTLRGTKEILESAIGRKVEIIIPEFAPFEETEDLPLVALIDKSNKKTIIRQNN